MSYGTYQQRKGGIAE